MFDNRTGVFLFADYLMAADWFEDTNGFLFIVPRPQVVAEIDGPDGPLMDAMNAACSGHSELTDKDCEKLELTRVDDVLKRFHPLDGYYHA